VTAINAVREILVSRRMENIDKIGYDVE